MLYKDVMPELKTAPRPQSLAGLTMLVAGRSRRVGLGNAISLGYWVPRFLPAWMLGGAVR